jgi:hypothetical protein
MDAGQEQNRQGPTYEGLATSQRSCPCRNRLRTGCKRPAISRGPLYQAYVFLPALTVESRMVRISRFNQKCSSSVTRIQVHRTVITALLGGTHRIWN